MRGLLPVAGHWVSVLTGLVPLALVIALSPLSVIPAVLVVHSPQPRPSSLAFLGGWLLGLAVVTAVFVAASGALGGLSTTSPAWAPEDVLYLRGSRMEASYPVSLVAHSQALNVTLQSYAGTLNFGFIGCRDTLPHLQRLAVYTGEALDQLAAADGAAGLGS